MICDFCYRHCDIKEGNYIVAFAYNNEKYRLTQYKATDNSEVTSKVIKLTIRTRLLWRGVISFALSVRTIR